jgi:hypothetical protein
VPQQAPQVSQTPAWIGGIGEQDRHLYIVR